MDKIATRGDIVDQNKISDQKEILYAEEIQALIFNGSYDSKKKKEFAELIREFISPTSGRDMDVISPKPKILGLTSSDMIRGKVDTTILSNYLIERYIHKKSNEAIAKKWKLWMAFIEELWMTFLEDLEKESMDKAAKDYELYRLLEKLWKKDDVCDVCNCERIHTAYPKENDLTIKDVTRERSDIMPLCR